MTEPFESKLPLIVLYKMSVFFYCGSEFHCMTCEKLNLIEPLMCMNKQVSDTGSCDSLVLILLGKIKTTRHAMC